MPRGKSQAVDSSSSALMQELQSRKIAPLTPLLQARMPALFVHRGIRVMSKATSGSRAVTFGAALVSLFEWLGGLGQFGSRLVRAAVTPPYEGRELLRQMDEIGTKSLPLVALAGAAIGVVLSLHTRDSLIHFGAESILPALIILSLIKETGPIITALVVSGRVGAGIGAELGSMKVTEQIDAIEASAVDARKFLASTRVLACMLMLPLLTIVADFVGILTGWLASTLAHPISLQLFVNHGFKNVKFNDFLPPTFKTAVFGL